VSTLARSYRLVVIIFLVELVALYALQQYFT
jgi:hypothetical protein